MPDTVQSDRAEAIVDVAGRVAAVDARLTAPDSPFELTPESVVGTVMPVFVRRPRQLGEYLDASLQWMDEEYLVFGDGPRVTFGEHLRLVDAVAAALADRHGIGKGDRIVVSGANSLGWILIAMACARLGSVVVAFNSWWSPAEAARAVALSQPTLIVADERRRKQFDFATGEISVLEMETVADALGSYDGQVSDRHIDEDDPWALVFTSGTSGMPKAATLTHRNLVGFVQLNAFLGARSALLADTAAAAVRSKPVRLVPFPLFHISGISTIVSALAFGTKTVWPTGRFDARRVIELSRDERVTVWGGASTHIVRLLDHPDLATFDATRLTSVGIGGSASTPALIARTEAAFPHLTNTFSSGYGMTECGGLASFASNEMLRISPECVGAPFPTVDVKIVDAAGGTLPEGALGSICIRSPLVMREYWNNPAANAIAMLPDRWLRTEDFGRIESGLLFLASRERDLIIRGGENVYPVEIENVLDQHPVVIESAVYASDDAEFGQIVVATVVVRPGADVSGRDLQEHCARALAYFKVPAAIEVRTAVLPRNASGKVLKRLLAEGQEDTAPVDPD